MPNRYYCSDGKRVTESTIKANYSVAIREKYQGCTVWLCEGCGAPAMGSAHIIPKSRLKILHKTELIWHPKMIFPACPKCNMICENVSSEEIKTLKNYETVKTIMELHDPERAKKLPQ
jgi:hypothetical protein